jgi:Co/Zn/Cd efflux system component
VTSPSNLAGIAGENLPIGHRKGSQLPARCCTDNSRVLWIVILLFATITIAQLLAAIAANSDALMVDGLSMLVDTATYVGNLCAEQYGGGPFSELLASGASFAILYGVALWGVIESAININDPGEREATLSPAIVLAFGVWGIAFDFLAFWGFYRWGLGSIVSRAGLPDDATVGLATAQEPLPEQEQPADGTQQPSMNMRSAFLHVGADMLRSVTTVVEGLLVLGAGTEPRRSDAVAALVVSVTILAGGCGASASWMQQAWKMRYELREKRRAFRLRRRSGKAEDFMVEVIGAPQQQEPAGNHKQVFKAAEASKIEQSPSHSPMPAG